MRCIALGQAWQDAIQETEDGGQKTDLTSELRPPTSVIFICAQIPEPLADRIKSEGFELIRIDADLGSPDDLQQTLNAIASLSVTSQSEIINHQSSITSPWLVLDGYHFHLDYQRGIRVAGIKLLLIDDYNHLPEYECDILLNQNINATDLNYRINPEARRLLGAEDALLRREFRNVDAMPPSRSPKVGPERSERGSIIAGQRPEGSAKNILVTLGGADPDNVTLKVIQALNHLNMPDLHVKIIVGPANPHLEVLRQALSSSTINCELINSVWDMPGLMQWADLAISAAGSTCWELCCLGVPFITLVLAENQRGLATELDRRAIASCLGENPSVDAIAGTITNLLTGREERTRRSKVEQELVDCFGTDRVLCSPAKDVGLDIFSGRLSLRSAAECDMALFWKWANDPSVRANCYNPEPIPLESHQKWFFSKLVSDDTLMLVLELDGIPAGQVRYDRYGDTADIGFSIDPRFRGLGLGQKIVEQSLNPAFTRLKIARVRAEVFAANSASQAVFIKTGFESEELCEIKGVPSFVFIKKRP